MNVVSSVHRGNCALSQHTLYTHISMSHGNRFTQCFGTQRTIKSIWPKITTPWSTSPKSLNSIRAGYNLREAFFQNSDKFSAFYQFSNSSDVCNKEIMGSFGGEVIMYYSMKSECQEEKARTVVSEPFLKLSEICSDYFCKDTLHALRGDIANLPRIINR